MKRYLLAILLAGCTDKANIGMSNQPVKCQPAATGVVNGTLTNTYTNKNYSFGSVQATLSGINGTNGNNQIQLDDSELQLQLAFQCPQAVEVATYNPAGGQPGCPFSVLATVSGNQQEVYGLAAAGDVIVDQTTGCIAGRYDITFEQTPNQPETTGELVGWFSVPLP